MAVLISEDAWCDINQAADNPMAASDEIKAVGNVLQGVLSDATAQWKADDMRRTLDWMDYAETFASADADDASRQSTDLSFLREVRRSAFPQW